MLFRGVAAITRLSAHSPCFFQVLRFGVGLRTLNVNAEPNLKADVGHLAKPNLQFRFGARRKKALNRSELAFLNLGTVGMTAKDLSGGNNEYVLAPNIG